MIKGLVIPPNGPTRFREIHSYVDLRQEVGGYIEVIGAPQSLIMYGNEDGKRHGLPPNQRASALAYAGGGMLADDVVVGNVVILGPPDGEGQETNIHADGEAFLRSVGLWPEDDGPSKYLDTDGRRTNSIPDSEMID